MRRYGVIAPAFWTGQTGRSIKEAGKDARILAAYFITSPHANMIGLYYLPWPLIYHETGLTEEESRTAFRFLREIGFCDYDDKTEMVWVPNMAEFQIGKSLKPADHNIRAIEKLIESLPKNPFIDAFMQIGRAHV